MWGDTDLDAVSSVAYVKTSDLLLLLEACNGHATTALTVAAYKPPSQAGEHWPGAVALGKRQFH